MVWSAVKANFTGDTMKIETLTVGSFSMNCYLVVDEDSGEAILIDPGAESDRLIDKIEGDGLDLKYIINTHCHIDHAAEVAQVMNHFKVPFYIHHGDLDLLNSLKEQGTFFGISVGEAPKVTKFVEDGNQLTFGNKTCLVIHTPGHSPGGISIKIDTSVFVGDCLFLNSIGRTDLPGGDYSQLINTIRTKLLSLDEATTVYPGHGPPTTIGRECRYNPFLNE
jgi:hydroxyacylglutathione hydrolase